MGHSARSFLVHFSGREVLGCKPQGKWGNFGAQTAIGAVCYGDTGRNLHSLGRPEKGPRPTKRPCARSYERDLDTIAPCIETDIFLHHYIFLRMRIEA